MIAPLPRPLIGTAYYPEQVAPERWAEDARQMVEAGISIVRVGEFAWAKLEIAQNIFDFKWLDSAIEALGAEGLKVIIGTPSSAPPPWMTIEEDILAVSVTGQPYTSGGRHFYCPSSPYYRSRCSTIARRLAEHYFLNYNVIGWQIDNELGNHGNMRCYCNRCKVKWQQWLRDTYQTLREINDTWGTVFWSQSYSDFNQIPLPTLTGGGYSPSLVLDYDRFASSNAIEFFNLQVTAIRESWTLQRGFITHNYFFGDTDVNFHELAENVDFISYDNYPHGMTGPREMSFYQDLAWSRQHGPYWIMEQQLGPINWTRYNPPVLPGQNRLWTLQNFLKGAQVTAFFSWQQTRFGNEQYHSGFLDHSGEPSRGFYEIQSLAAELDELPDNFFRRQAAEVGLLYSIEDFWALENEPHNAAFRYQTLVKDIHASLTGRYIPCDILPRGSDATRLNSYKVIIAPAAYLNDAYENELWRNYVEQGGKLLFVMRANVKEFTNVWVTGKLPGGIAEWVGAKVLETISLPPHEPGDFSSLPVGSRPVAERKPIKLQAHNEDDADYTAHPLWAEVLVPTRSRTLLSYDSNDTSYTFAGQAALTKREWGEGAVYYLGTWPEDALYDYLWRELELRRLVPLEPTLGLEVIATGAEGEILAMLNHNSHALEIAMPPGYSERGREAAAEKLVLPPFGVTFIELRMKDEDRPGTEVPG